MRFVIVTGMSGAGKTTALNALRALGVEVYSAQNAGGYGIFLCG